MRGHPFHRLMGLFSLVLLCACTKGLEPGEKSSASLDAADSLRAGGTGVFGVISSASKCGATSQISVESADVVQATAGPVATADVKKGQPFQFSIESGRYKVAVQSDNSCKTSANIEVPVGGFANLVLDCTCAN